MRGKFVCKLSAFLCRLQGYTKPREYIVTEWPLKNSLGEFWSLVYDYECSAVVVLAVPDPGLVRNIFIFSKKNSIFTLTNNFLFYYCLTNSQLAEFD